MRRELVSVDELKAKLRQQGIENLDQVKAAYMESDGEISVIRLEGDDKAPSPSAPHKRAAR